MTAHASALRSPPAARRATSLGRRALAALLLAAPLPAAAQVVEVPGRSDPWLAGMPDGATASGGDVAPDHSPVLVPGLDLDGAALAFVVSGSVSHGGGEPWVPPDGAGPMRQAAGAQNGIAGLTAPIDSLIGLFLDDGGPDDATPPEELDFSTPESREAAILSPALRQPFHIGDGLTSDGARQLFMVPQGATRLYLGSMDGYGWFNNSGAFRVEILGGAANSAGSAAGE